SHQISGPRAPPPRVRGFRDSGIRPRPREPRPTGSYRRARTGSDSLTVRCRASSDLSARSIVTVMVTSQMAKTAMTFQKDMTPVHDSGPDFTDAVVRPQKHSIEKKMLR